MGFDLSYEIDVWGQIRNNVLAAEKQAQASETQIAFAELSFMHCLLNTYFNLRGVRLKTSRIG